MNGSYRTPDYMNRHCPVSCRSMDSAPTPECRDVHPRCNVWAQLGECKVNKEMKRYCPRSCGTCTSGDPARKLLDDNSHDQEIPGIDSAVDDDFLCVDNHEKCSKWAVRNMQISWFRCLILWILFLLYMQLLIYE